MDRPGWRGAGFVGWEEGWRERGGVVDVPPAPKPVDLRDCRSNMRPKAAPIRAKHGGVKLWSEIGVKVLSKAL